MLRKHYFFGFRPARTYLYSEFDSRTWSAHLGMGNETAGYAIAGEPQPLTIDSQVTSSHIGQAEKQSENTVLHHHAHSM